MNKKITTIISLIIMGMAMTGCFNNKDLKDEKPQDVNFVKDVGKSFSSRSDYVDKVQKQKITVDDEISYLTKCADIELDILSKYKEALFSDATLRKLALDYIEGVEIQKNSLKYYSSDSIKYSENWDLGYDTRSVALVRLVDEYKVVISEEDLRDLRANSQVIQEENELENQLSEIMKNIKFEKTKDDYGLRYYSAIVENTTDVSFDSFSMDIKLLETDGVIAENQYVYANNWNPGEKVKLEFITTTKFESLEWEYDYILK